MMKKIAQTTKQQAKLSNNSKKFFGVQRKSEGKYPGGYFENQVKDLDHMMDNIYPMLQTYIRENDERDTKVVQYETPTELRKKFDVSLPKESQSLDVLIKSVEDIMKYSVRTQNANFYNQLYAGSKSVGQMSEFLVGVFNTAVHTYAVSPVFAMMEVECVKETAKAFGYDVETADGLFVPGGTYANMSALMIARHKFFPHVKLHGFKPTDRPVSFASPQCHYSVKRAAMMAGMGMESVIQVKSNINGDMIPEELDAAIAKAIEAGQQPFFVNATAGTTVMGGYDDFHKINEICRKYNVWYHIDGCWGASAIFSDKIKYKMSGCNLSDSIAINFHKQLSVPNQTNMLVTNNHKGLLQDANSSNAVYLFHKHEASEYDLGDKSLQCGRRSDSLKLWLAWKHEGTDGFARQVDHAQDMTKYFRDNVVDRADRGFVLVSEPDSANVCFFYVPKALRGYKNIADIYDKLNTVTPLLYRRMQYDGYMLVNYNPLIDHNLPYFFRIILIQESVTTEHLDHVLDSFERLGEDITEADIQAHIKSLE